MTRYCLDDLRYLMRRLRDPETGCPWDLKQNYATIVNYTLEEVYEVVETIEQQNYTELAKELGDLLFQVVFYTQLAEEDGYFEFSDVIHNITHKLVMRHPHVFPDGTLRSRRDPNQPQQESAIKETWEALKRQERAAVGNVGILDDVPLALPSLVRAQKLQKRAASVGFDWPDVDGVWQKLAEESGELQQAVSSGDRDHIAEEAGDLLFVLVNLVRKLGLDAEHVLRMANTKFSDRFRQMEADASQDGTSLEQLTLDQLEQLWQRAKRSNAAAR